MRVWWESRHPLPQTNTTEHFGNCWLTLPSRNHTAMQNHHLPTRRCLFAPANRNTDSHTCWQRYYHLKITVFLLVLHSFLKKQPARPASNLSPYGPVMYLHALTTAIDRGTWSSSKSTLLPDWYAPTVLIEAATTSAALEGKKKKKGRHRATAQRHRWKDHSLWYSFSIEP